MHKLGRTPVGGSNPVRIMGIINTSPESFYKKSVKISRSQIRNAVIQMECDGADFVDVGGMSTAPYLSTHIPEKTELCRILEAIKIVRDVSDLPISVDTCRASVAKAALENGAEIVNDITGLKFDKKMTDVISLHKPSVILCAYDTKTVTGDPIKSTKALLRESVTIAKDCGLSQNKLVLDPAIGFFRRSGRGKYFTRTHTDWNKRDIQIICNLRSIKQRYPLLISVSNKSFLGNILERDDPPDRIFGSIAAEAISVLYGADIIRTHNVAQTRDAVLIASEMSGRSY